MLFRSSYQWIGADGKDIAGATNAAYTYTIAADAQADATITLKCKITNTNGTATASVEKDFVITVVA